MDAVLLDTDVFSFLLKRKDRRAELYKRHVQGKTVAVAFVTVGELYAGALKANWGPARIADLEYRLKQVIIVPYDLDVCRAYGRMANLKTPQGGSRVLPANDRWIAACAIRHAVPLITHNRKDYEGIPDLSVISESDTPPEPQQDDGLFPGEPPETSKPH